MVRFIGHEVRTPLNTVGMGLQYLLLQLEKKNITLTKDCEEALGECQRSCDDGVEILNKLLLFEKIDSNLLELDRTYFHIHTFLEDIIHTFRRQVCIIIIHNIVT